MTEGTVLTTVQLFLLKVMEPYRLIMKLALKFTVSAALLVSVSQGEVYTMFTYLDVDLLPWSG